ncbi:MAG: peroxiredoxin [Pseudomonadota bacterium]|nr:peroxiredoxin [Pseudomonadota bacterium]
MIKVGDRLPEATFKVMTPDGPANRTTNEIFGGKKVVLFGVPGAFTPTCHRNHLPGYLENLDTLRSKGIDSIVCVAVNDVFVLDAWAKSSGAQGRIEFLSDGNAEFTRAIGLSLDASGFGMGTRSQRYAMLVDDGVVKSINVEDAPSKADISSAASMMKVLEAA